MAGGGAAGDDEQLVVDSFGSARSPRAGDVLHSALYNPLGESTETWSMPSGGITLQPVLPSIAGVQVETTPVKSSRIVTTDGVVLKDRPWMHPSPARRKGRLGRLQELEHQISGDIGLRSIHALRSLPKGVGDGLPTVPPQATLRPLRAIPDDAKGLSRLQAALNSVVGTLVTNNASLEDAWGDLTQHIEKYLDHKKVSALGKQVLDLLHLTTAQTAKYKQPCNPVTNATVAAVDQIFIVALNAYPSLEGLILEVRGHLHRSLFLSGTSDLFAGLEAGWTFDDFCKDSEKLWLDAVRDLSDRKNYFQACRMLTKTLADKEMNIDHFSVIKHKGEGSLELVVRYWKSHLLGTLFRAWRGVTRADTAVRDFAGVVDDLRKELSSAAKATEEARRRERKAVMQAKLTENALQMQIDTQISQLISERHAKKQLQTQLAILRKRSESSPAPMDPRLAELARLLGEYEQSCSGSPYEAKLRDELSTFVEVEADVTPDFLLRWADALIQKSPSFDGSRITRIDDLKSDLKRFLLLLAAMSPRHVPPAFVEGVASGDGAGAASAVLAKVEEMGMVPSVTSDELLAEGPSGVEGLLGCLFVRFAAATPQAVQFGPLEDAAAPQTSLSPSELVRRHVHAAKWTNLAFSAQRFGQRRKSSLKGKQEEDAPAKCRLTDALQKRLGAGAMREINALFDKYEARLRQTFARFSDGKPHITLTQFWSVIDTAALFDGALTRRGAEHIVSDTTGGTATGDGSLTVEAWLSVLVVMAMEKYRAADAPADGFLRMMENHIFRVGIAVPEETPFRSLVFSTGVQDTLAAHRPSLKALFDAYQSQAEGGSAQVAAKDFLRLLSDMDVLNGVCTREAIEDTLNECISKDGAAASPGLLFQEFLLAICAAAVYKLPAPFLSLAAKVQTFLTGTILPFADACNKTA